MSFWSDSGGVEPLRQYRWYLTFGGQTTGIDLLKFALKKCDKPKSKVNSIQHKYLNHFFNYPGRLEWEDINITFAAIRNPSTSKVLYDILSNSGYMVPKDNKTASDMKTPSKYKFGQQIAGNGVSLIQIDADGNKIEEWLIKNPFFTSVQFGSLDYGSEEIVDVQCTLKYDWAELQTPTAATTP